MRFLRGLWAGLTAVLPLALPLLISASLAPGREVILPRALWLLGCLAAVTTVAKVAMALLRPANLEMRGQSPVAARARKQPLIDAVGVVAYLLYLVGWFAFIPLDVGILHLAPPPPPWAGAIGFGVAMLGVVIATLAVWENVFATPAIQEQAGQYVVDTGVYGMMRHPLYAGNLLLFVGTALWMGSLAALVGVLVMLAATLARIAIEERFLRAALSDYGDYARRVPARLVPFVI